MIKIKLKSLRIMMLVLIESLLIVSSIYAETAQEYYRQGLANGEKGNYAQAILDFTKAIEINPNYPGAYENRANTYFYQGNYAEAISDYTKMIETDPNDATSYNNRGLAYYEEKEYDKAWADVHEAEELGFTVDSEFINKLKKASGRDK